MSLSKNYVVRIFDMLFGAEINKFRIGQIFFISAVTVGLFFSDTTRKILLICALCCLTKEQISEKFYISWTKEQKITGSILLLLCAWIFLVPLIFGVDPLMERLQSTGWIIELMIWMWATFFFAKDFFFLENSKRFAIVACLLYSVLALCQRYSLGFVVDFSNWPLRLGAWSVGTILSVLLPWVLYDLMTSVSHKKTVGLLFALILISATLILTLYTTFWLVLVVQMVIALSLLQLFSTRNFFKMLVLISIPLIIAVIILYLASFFSKNLYNGFFVQLCQLSFDGFNAEKFTNQRYHIWVEAFDYIKLHPILGYGWAEFANFSVEKRIHTHSAFLQAAWTAGWPAVLLLIAFLSNLIYRCIVLMRNEKKLLIVPCVVLLVVFTYITCGILDDMFRATRRIVTLYWVTFVLMLTPLVNYDKNDINNQ